MFNIIYNFIICIYNIFRQSQIKTLDKNMGGCNDLYFGILHKKSFSKKYFSIPFSKPNYSNRNPKID